MSDEKTEYLEPTRRARIVAVLGLLLLLMLAFASFFLPEWIVDASSQSPRAGDNILLSSFVGAMWSSGVHVLICVVAVYIAFQAVRSGQWPPKGFGTPMRKRIVRIKQPARVWLGLGLFILVFSIQPAIAWYSYFNLKNSIRPASGFAESPSPEEVMRLDDRVTEYLDAEKRGDFETMYRLRDGDFKKAVSESDFTEILRQCCREGLIIGYETHGGYFQPGGQAIMGVTVSEPLREDLAGIFKGDQLDLDIEMVWEREPEGWRCADAGARNFGLLTTPLSQ